MMIPTDSSVYQKAFEQYLRRGTPIERSLKRMMKAAETSESHTTTHYIWRTAGDDKVRPSHAANEGERFAWDNPPDTGHPGEDINCRCVAEPYYGITEPPLDSSYLDTFAIALVIALLVRFPQLAIIWRAWFLRRGASREWQLSKTKSAQKWANRMEKGSWITEKITQTIKNGTRYKVKNERTGGAATRYELNGSYVVRDDTTGDILQLSGPEHIAKIF
jgi:hypothetical protein